MIETRDLTLKVGGTLLLDKLNVRLEAGQCWCVVGRNGAGKTTLLRVLAGLRAAEAGVVLYEGRAPNEWAPLHLARKRAYLPQGRNDAFSFTALETALAARHPYRDSRYWESDEDCRAALDALQIMDVGHLARRDVRTLSGGERQRVAIAAALAQDTPVLLLDEPANALDLAHQAGVMKRVAHLCAAENKMVMLVSHDLNLVQAAASHVLLLSGDGTWRAGLAADMLQAQLLSACLGHPIEAARHGERIVFLPQ